MSVNKVILIGNLGKDPEMRYTPNQLGICTFSMATTERRKDATGNYVDQTEWHRVVTFGKTAENCNQFLKKGRKAYVEGAIRTNKWTDKEGKDRYTTEIVANTVQFLDPMSRGGQSGQADSPPSGDDGSYGQYAPPSPQQMASVLGGLVTADAAQAMGKSDLTFDDDDVPF